MSVAALTRWTSIQSAAEVLGMSSAALRKTLDRRAVRTADGGIEAELDGVRARKLGRIWRVSLSTAWSQPQVAGSSKPKHSPPSSQNLRDDREGTRS